MFRLIALTSSWSWDYWLDVRHDNPELVSPDEGPNGHEFILAASWNDRPSGRQLGDAVAELQQFVLLADGHSEIHSHSLLDEAEWEAFRAASRSMPPSDMTERNQPDSYEQGGTWAPILVDDLMTFDQAIETWRRCGARISQGERGHLGENDPALFPDR